MRDFIHGPDHCHIGTAVDDIPDERAVYFQEIDVQVFQVGVGGIAGAEIIQGEFTAKAFDLFDEILDMDKAVRGNGLGYFKSDFSVGNSAASSLWMRKSRKASVFSDWPERLMAKPSMLLNHPEFLAIQSNTV